MAVCVHVPGYYRNDGTKGTTIFSSDVESLIETTGKIFEESRGQLIQSSTPSIPPIQFVDRSFNIGSFNRISSHNSHFQPREPVPQSEKEKKENHFKNAAICGGILVLIGLVVETINWARHQNLGDKKIKVKNLGPQIQFWKAQPYNNHLLHIEILYQDTREYLSAKKLTSQINLALTAAFVAGAALFTLGGVFHSDGTLVTGAIVAGGTATFGVLRYIYKLVRDDYIQDIVIPRMKETRKVLCDPQRIRWVLADNNWTPESA